MFFRSSRGCPESAGHEAGNPVLQDPACRSWKPAYVMIMKSQYLPKANHFAIAGFLLPFGAAGLTGALLLAGKEEFGALKYSLVYLTVVPLILLAGVFLCLKAIPLIPERGDKDYAYSGLTLGILFFFMYLISLIYFFSSHSS